MKINKKSPSKKGLIYLTRGEDKFFKGLFSGNVKITQRAKSPFIVNN
jgi:hypothetical protein